MDFVRHYEVEGLHAFLGASKYHWINYDLEKLERMFANQFAAQKGTRLHALAAEMIRMKIKARGNNTMAAFVNDAIGYRMTPEQVLFVNTDCFGTADAISFDKGVLRIHDLKTGVHPGSFHQLECYMAFFCIEYRINPFNIEGILRLYQNDEIFEQIADPNEIDRIMKQIELATGHIAKMREVIA